MTLRRAESRDLSGMLSLAEEVWNLKRTYYTQFCDPIGWVYVFQTNYGRWVWRAMRGSSVITSGRTWRKSSALAQAKAAVKAYNESALRDAWSG